MTKKIGRNAKCPCGSGLKHKKCCGASSPRQRPSPVRAVSFDQLPSDIRDAFIQHQFKEADRLRRFGHVRPPIAVDHKGYRVVAVGSKIHWSPKWKTFHDFLIDYIAGVFGKDWGDSELKKPYEERHPLVQWYKSLCDLQAKSIKEPGKIYSAVATGPVMAYMSLAYDLYTMDHHTLLQQRLVQRLKVKQQFQGARYETYVSAAFVRAGFDVNLEDETDTTTSHCEFNAIHRETAAGYSVEAKSRHREGYLGQAGTPRPLEDIELDVSNLLKKALRKRADYERIIFIDVNVPPAEGGPSEAGWFDKIAGQLRKLEEGQTPEKRWPSAFVFFTNHPYHYVGDDKPEPGRTAIFTAINTPDFKEPNAKLLSKHPALNEMVGSVFNHVEIPSDFDI